MPPKNNIFNTPNYFLDAWNRNSQRFAVTPRGLEVRGYTPSTKFVSKSVGSGEMKPFPETTYTKEGEEPIVIGDTATNLAINWASSHLKNDPSENLSNLLMAGGFGLFKLATNGSLAFLNYLGDQAKYWMPRLNFSSVSTAGKGLGAAASTGASAADAAFATATTVPTLLDINNNGINWTNGTELALGLTPIVPNVYKYGLFVTNNYHNLGRYTLDNLRPMGYITSKQDVLDKFKALFKTWTLPLYKEPPTFYKHRPKWYEKWVDKEMADARFENGANWARIPEEEVPRTYFKTNDDGTIIPTELYLDDLVTPEYYMTYNKEGELVKKPTNFKNPGDYIVIDDLTTPGLVGGEHSNYTYLGEDPLGNKLISYEDIQMLNPLWKITDPIKKLFTPNSLPYNFLDKIGGIDLSWLVGYKPFIIKYGMGFTPNSNSGKLVDINKLKNVLFK